MTHRIPFSFPQGDPLPIPHFFGWPDYTPEKTYDAIVPESMVLQEGDEVFMTHYPESLYSKKMLIKKVIIRRAANGDWSSQHEHKNPDFIRFVIQ